MFKVLSTSGSQVVTAAIAGGADMICGTYK
jgi:hypothetical protein